MFHSLQHNVRDCLGPVCSVVFLWTSLLSLEGLSHMYTCGSVSEYNTCFFRCFFSAKLSFEEIQTLLCILYFFTVIIYCTTVIGIVQKKRNDFL
jgi:hypothetical protein